MLQQPPFHLRPVCVATEPMGCNHPVAGDYQRHRVVPNSLSHSLCRHARPQPTGQLSVGSSRAVRYRQQHLPHPRLKLSPHQMQRRHKVRHSPREIAVQPILQTVIYILTDQHSVLTTGIAPNCIAHTQEPQRTDAHRVSLHLETPISILRTDCHYLFLNTLKPPRSPLPPYGGGRHARQYRCR